MTQRHFTLFPLTSSESIDEVIERDGLRYTRVRSLEHLKHLAHSAEDDHIVECILVLSGGARRSKLIQYSFSKNGRHWYVDDMCEGKGKHYTNRQLRLMTMIPKAIATGCFYMEEVLST